MAEQQTLERFISKTLDLLEKERSTEIEESKYKYHIFYIHTHFQVQILKLFRFI